MIRLFFLCFWVLILSHRKKNWWLRSSAILIIFFITLKIIPFLEYSNYLIVGLSIDFIGFRLIILRFYITILIINSSWIIIKIDYFYKYFLLGVIGLIFVLLICFSIRNLIMFYLFFEVSLIPTLFIIIGWGFQLERLQAGVYFLFYTITASLPLLLNIVFYYSNKGSFSISLINIINSFKILGVLEYGFILRIVLAFLVKLPIFFFHLWLPKAHVEAPVAGSIILAGVLLKLGGYGLIRVIPIVVGKILIYSYVFIRLGLSRMVFIGLICWRLNDLKALVAYSSVAHIGLVICGVIRISLYGRIGVLVIIIGHGISSSGIFCLVNIIYERFRRRSLFLRKGIINIIPSLRFIFFILCAANISAPPTINLIGEIFLLIRVIGFRFLIIFLFSVGSFFGAVFTLFIYSYRQHGKNYKITDNLIFVLVNEYHTIILHLVPLNLLVLKLILFFH